MMKSRIPNSPFLFSSEQQEFAEAVATLARREFHDGYLERATSDAMCWNELKRLGKHGLIGMALPPELGGQQADPVSRGIACEHIARADFNLAYLVLCSEVLPVLRAGLPEHVSHPLLRAVTAGDQLVAVALTEPTGGSDTSGLAVHAKAVPDGYRLHGEKTSVTLGMHASHAIVVATTDPGRGSKASRRLLVPLDDPSIFRQRFTDPGFRPLSRASLTFDGTFVPADHEIDATASGLSAQLAEFDLSRTLLGLMVIGAARRAMDASIAWVREREAFGEPIARNQGVSFPLAEYDTQLEAARWLCYRALSLRAAQLPHTREAAMCKWWAPRVAVQAINDCIVLHGHAGWSSEMPLQQLLLDVSGLQIGDGTPQIQKLVIARQLIGRQYVG